MLDSNAGAEVGSRGPAYGVVHNFTLLTTTLQDMRGALTYVSNGNIALVTNYSQNPQKALVLVHIDHSQDPEKMQTQLAAFVDTLALDPELKGKVLRPPSVKGVTSTGEKSYIITVSALAAPAATPYVERHMRRKLLHYLHEAGMHATAAVATKRMMSQ